ncbi:MAG: hypothetical protein NVSMB32_08610 [Actinomycetota bacterium]
MGGCKLCGRSVAIALSAAANALCSYRAHPCHGGRYEPSTYPERVALTNLVTL